VAQALARRVAIARLKLDGDVAAAKLLRGDRRSAGAGAGIEYDVAGTHKAEGEAAMLARIAAMPVPYEEGAPHQLVESAWYFTALDDATEAKLSASCARSRAEGAPSGRRRAGSPRFVLGGRTLTVGIRHPRPFGVGGRWHPHSNGSALRRFAYR
jgi:hypothetical protein